MIAYAEYYTDARIKSYVNILKRNNYEVDVICLKDSYTKNTPAFHISVFGLLKKYQGDDIIAYVLNYLFFFILAIFKTTLLYVVNRYKIIHVHNQPDFLVFTTIIPKLFGCKILLDMHDIMIAGVMTKFQCNNQSFLYKLVHLQTKLSISYSNTLICADHSQKKFLANQHLSHQDLHVLLNLPDESFFRERSTSPDDNIIKFVYHGTVAYRLGLDFAIRTFVDLKDRINATLTIIGNGDQKEELIKQTKLLGCYDKLIFFKDFIPVEYLQNELEKYHIGIIPNRKTLVTEQCMLPVKLLEYIAIGLPVIAPRLQIISDYFTDDMVLFYIPEDINSFSDCIIRLAESHYLQKKLISGSRTFFNFFNWSNQGDEYLRMVDCANPRYS